MTPFAARASREAAQLPTSISDAPVLENHHVARAERAMDEAGVVKRLHGRTEVERQT
jgi:hypothetical protein